MQSLVNKQVKFRSQQLWQYHGLFLLCQYECIVAVGFLWLERAVSTFSSLPWLLWVSYTELVVWYNTPERLLLTHKV